MIEYIERAAAVKVVLRERKSTNSVAQNRMLSIIQRDLLTMCAANVAPVTHGKWHIMSGTKTRRVCSHCGWDVPEYGKFYSYYPNCGAKMDGEGNAED